MLLHTRSKRGTVRPSSTPAICTCFPVGSLPSASPTFIPLYSGMLRMSRNTPSVRMINRADLFVGFVAAAPPSSSSPAADSGNFFTLSLKVPMPRSFHSLPVKWKSFPRTEKCVSSSSSPVSAINKTFCQWIVKGLTLGLEWLTLLFKEPRVFLLFFKPLEGFSFFLVTFAIIFSFLVIIIVLFFL